MEETDRLIEGRYRLREKVGQGAMGVVWQSYDEQLHRVVAAKELLALDGMDDAKINKAKARAMREARLAARLEHPNAIRVYDVVEDGGQPWLIMEYLPSRSLAVVIAEQGTLPPKEVARIGCHTAAALAAAHRHGIQHRDVKPGNILIGEQDVKITDFGISRATGDAATTATGTVGTPAFFSPEVARGEEAGLPSDVFSLGATLYNAVEGAPPHGTASNHIAMLHKVASGKIAPAGNAGPLAPVLERLLDVDPAKRPTMAEAVHLLAAVVNGLPHESSTVVLPSTVTLPEEARTPPAEVTPEETAQQEWRAVPPAAEMPAEMPAEPPTPLPPPVPAEDREHRKFPIVPVAVVLLMLIVGIGAYLLWPKNETIPSNNANTNTQPTGNPDNPAQGTQGQTQPDTAPQNPPSQYPASPTTPPSGTGTPTQPPPNATPQSAAQAMSSYYAMIPGDLPGAYAKLTDGFKARRNIQQFESYRSFWAQFSGIQLSNVTPQGDTVVSATVTFMRGGAPAEVEQHTYTLVRQNGVWMIDNQAP